MAQRESIGTPGSLISDSQLFRGGSFRAQSLPGRVTYGLTALDGWVHSLRRELLDTSPTAVLVTSPACTANGLDLWVKERLDPIEVVALYGDCARHTPSGVVAELQALLEELRPQLVVALGGGSVIDAAKAARAGLAVRSDPLIPSRTGAAGWTERPALVAIPTTLAGAEHTARAAQTDLRTRRKTVRELEGGAPDDVVLDPRVTGSVPRTTWIESGVKCVSDACEQLLSTQAMPLTDMLCTASIRLFRENLGASPEHLEARLRCQIATWYTLFGILAAGVGGGYAAGFRHHLAPMTGLSHGGVAAALLVPVVRFCWDGSHEARRPFSEAWGLEADVDVSSACGTIRDYLRSLGVGGPLEAKLTPSEVHDLCDLAFRDVIAAGSPRQANGPDDLLLLLGEALGGSEFQSRLEA